MKEAIIEFTPLVAKKKANRKPTDKSSGRWFAKMSFIDMRIKSSASPGMRELSVDNTVFSRLGIGI